MFSGNFEKLAGKYPKVGTSVKQMIADGHLSVHKGRPVLLARPAGYKPPTGKKLEQKIKWLSDIQSHFDKIRKDKETSLKINKLKKQMKKLKAE